MDFRESTSFKAAISSLHSIDVDKTLNERIQYKDDTFPFGVWTDIYKYFIDHTVNYHWHNDFEYGVLLEGEVDYYINDTQIKLVKGDVIFINSNILHSGRQTDNSESSVMYTFTFPASLLSSNTSSTIYSKYLQPLLNTRIAGFRISEESIDGREIKALLMRIYELDPSAFGYELECVELLNRLWLSTLRYINENNSNLFYRANDMRQSDRMKEILSYIHEHFNQKIVAIDIANHLNISRSECFRCFKHFMNKTLVEYVNEYRLRRSTILLRETEKSIIDISVECGFEHVSYFSRLFLDAYSMTPLQYRKAQIWTNNMIQNINNYDYQYWKDSGNGTMIITANANNGSFSCEWNNIHSIMFRSGKKFNKFEKTHGQLGNILLHFDASFHSEGCSYLCVYGWTVDPLIEWYIVERFSHFSPSEDLISLGTFDVDGGTYENFHVTRINQPTILGIGTFDQYWSIRTSGRDNGTVDVSAHFRAWENMGLKLGNLTEIALSIECWKSNGSAVVNTNILSITDGE